MKVLLFFTRFILGLRYKVVIKGIENLKHNGPVLIFPNHVALIDPRILISFLGKYLKVSPVASEKYYNKPVLKQVMDLFGTVPIGEMSAGASTEDVKKVFENITKALKEGKNILLYPSGQIYRQGYESIKGKQSAYYITKQMPENTKVIGIKDRGLWGSIWSMARDNGKTSFGKVYLKSIFYVLVNFIFFVPKRKVSLEIFDITDEINAYKNMSLNEFNSYLENFYNSFHSVSSKEGEVEQKEYIEPVNYIKHYFYYDDVKEKKLPEIIKGSEKELNMVKKYNLDGIDEKIKNQIKTQVAKIKEIDKSKINEDSKLIMDLFFDSLDLAEIKSFIQSNFDKASNPPIGDLKTVGDLIIMAIGKSSNEEELKPCKWKENEIKESLLIEKII